MAIDLTPEEMKAWSQNLGHNDVLTTFTSYGSVPAHRQGELIRRTGTRDSGSGVQRDRAIKELIDQLQRQIGSRGLVEPAASGNHDSLIPFIVPSVAPRA